MLNRLPVVVSPNSGVAMQPAPINPAWILVGAPVARAAQLSHSQDHDACTCLWDCTAGTFRWRFDCDETVHILDGDVLIYWNGEKHQLHVGDTAYFPAGSITTWQVNRYVRKVAFLRQPAPRVISLSLRLWRKLKRMGGLGTAPAGDIRPQVPAGQEAA